MNNNYNYMVQLRTQKSLRNQISNFEELECDKSSNVNQLKLKFNLITWIKLDIAKLNEFNLLKKEVEEFG